MPRGTDPLQQAQQVSGYTLQMIAVLLMSLKRCAENLDALMNMSHRDEAL